MVMMFYCVVTLLALDLWPSGTYGIPKPQGGCPSPASQWSSGSKEMHVLFYFDWLGDRRRWNKTGGVFQKTRWNGIKDSKVWCVSRRYGTSQNF